MHLQSKKSRVPNPTSTMPDRRTQIVQEQSKGVQGSSVHQNTWHHISKDPRSTRSCQTKPKPSLLNKKTQVKKHNPKSRRKHGPTWTTRCKLNTKRIDKGQLPPLQPKADHTHHAPRMPQGRTPTWAWLGHKVAPEEESVGCHGRSPPMGPWPQ